MLIVDRALAQFLEHQDAQGTADYARLLPRFVPGADAAVLPVGGGSAICTGARFPINRAIGVGMNAPVTDAELDAIEAFYRRHDLPPAIDVCPLADSSLIALLNERGYRLGRFLNVNVREIQRGASFVSNAPEVRVTRVEPDDAELWIQTAAQGFDGRDVALPDDDTGVILARIGYHRPDATCFLAWIGDEPAGAGAMVVSDGLATLFSGSTRPAFRGQGAQTALLGARLQAAAQAGCALATVGNVPDGAAQRNVYRAGFQTAYTLVTMMLD